MSSRQPELSTTSYAILGLLAIQPWSTYELAKQMRRGIHFFWPRAESKIYDEPKKLVEHGYARAASEPTGRRRRTVYTITPRGRRALKAWQQAETGGSRWESEPIVKLVFSTHGTRDDLLRHVTAFRAEAQARWRALAEVVGPYLEGDDPFPGRTHINALAARLVLETARTEIAWADAALEEIQQWPDTPTAAVRAASLDHLRAALQTEGAAAYGNRPSEPGRGA
jgi:DNA-binding PadR family transcriptional regulator